MLTVPPVCNHILYEILEEQQSRVDGDANNQRYVMPLLQHAFIGKIRQYLEQNDKRCNSKTHEPPLPLHAFFKQCNFVFNVGNHVVVCVFKTSDELKIDIKKCTE